MSINIEKLEMPVKNVAEYEKTPSPEKVAVVKPQGNTLDGKTNLDKTASVKDKDNKALEKGRVLSKDTLDSAFADMNSKLKAQRTRCEYNYDEATNRVSIKVYDKETDELVLEAPPEETIEALKKTLELAGIIVDKKF